MTRYVLSEDGDLCAPNDATEDCKSLMDWAHEFDAMRKRAETAEARIRELEAALRHVGMILKSDSIEYDDMRGMDSIIDAALASSAQDRGDEHG
jgi:hypothetical protein